jgi:hypothetical protein
MTNLYLFAEELSPSIYSLITSYNTNAPRDISMGYAIWDYRSDLILPAVNYLLANINISNLV